MRRDGSSFELLFKDHYSSLCFFATNLVGDSDIAEDIVAEAFLKFHFKLDTLKNPDAAKTYLYSIVRNDCLEWHRKQKMQHRYIESTILQTQPDHKTILNAITEAEFITEIFQAVESLPRQCRRIFSMFYFERKSSRQIAEELNLSVNTIRNQRARALQLIRSRVLLLLILIYSYLS